MGTLRKYDRETKRKNFKKVKGEAEHLGGNPYRSKPAFRAEEPSEVGFFGGSTRRSFYGDRPRPSVGLGENGVPAFDSGRPSD